MSDNMKTYEGMFLLDAGISDFQAACEPVQAVLERSEAETLSMKPWEERRLAYEVNGHRRGMYVLVYFKVDPEKIREIEHDCQLHEQILRILILHKENLSDDVINAETPADVLTRRTAEAEARKVAEEVAAAEAAAAKAAAEAAEAAAAPEAEAGAEGEAPAEEAAPAEAEVAAEPAAAEGAAPAEEAAPAEADVAAKPAAAEVEAPAEEAAPVKEAAPAEAEEASEPTPEKPAE